MESNAEPCQNLIKTRTRVATISELTETTLCIISIVLLATLGTDLYHGLVLTRELW